MGMDLFNPKGEYFRFNWDWWHRLVCLAYTHGWLPEFINDPDHYFSNGGQHVSAADAQAMAAAIESALPHLADFDALEDKGVDGVVISPDGRVFRVATAAPTGDGLRVVIDPS